ncbi:MAG: DUF1549 domain-containing protein [Acidobacteria bacterium]|nr:DUF1549 domain-containing protein [Acidobacteriota bacterium]
MAPVIDKLARLSVVLTGLALAASGALRAEDGAAFFEKRVRPLLAQQCYACHSQAGNVAMGGLKLDSREGLLAGGGRGPALTPGKPAESLLLTAIRHVDEKLQMPPTGKLPDADIATLAEWVEMGAPWGTASAQAEPASQTWWSFVPPSEPTIPSVKNQQWVRSPIDAFVLAKLEEKGLQPAPPADKRTLIRRATFDLIGLPPTPKEIHDFLADDSPQAFARVIDRLLASPRYGERWGRHWLDVARYADSNGLDENLVYKNAFRYRDYVIAAFNKDKPFDRFLHEQLAGDLLPPSDDLETMYERWTATGFLSLGAKMLAEDDPVKMQMDIVDEQLDTTARAFMGLTMGCARCHDHKFDPIPTADYYAMAGIFKSSKTMENFNVVARWHEYVLAPEDDRRRLAEHEQRIEDKGKAIGKISKAENHRLVTAAWEKTGDYLLAADAVLRERTIELEPLGMNAAVRRDAGSFDEGNVRREVNKGETNVPEKTEGPFFAEYAVEVPAAGDYQLDFLNQETGKGTADLHINGVKMAEGAEAVANRAASPDAGGWTVAGVFALEAGKNTIRLEHAARFPYFEAFGLTPSPLPAGKGPRTPLQIARQYDVKPGFLEQWVERLNRSKGAPASVLFAWHAFNAGESLAGWASPAAQAFGEWPVASREELAARYQTLFSRAAAEWRTIHPEAAVDFTKNERYKDAAEDPGLPDAGLEVYRKLLYEKFGPFRPPSDARQYYPEQARAQIKQLEQERKDLEASTPEYPRAMGVREGTEISDIPIHVRGSHWTLGDVTPRRFLTAIAGDAQPPLPEAESGRLQLARWMTRPDHPLTSRVIANRFWRWHFGRGIVSSTDNFGRLGQKPVNQPLLDWLALRFVEDGWSMKAMHRRIMLSSAYQMSSRYDERAAEIDPENDLLWRMRRQRLDAEPMRDAIVSFSDDLDLEMGGSIMTFKDRQYVANTAAKGAIDYNRNLRTVYLPVVRSSMYDVLRAFDFADPSVANGDRNATVVAPQALFMMNGQVVLEHSRRMAENLLARGDLDDAGRVRYAFERVLSRLPDANELDRAQTFVAEVDRALADRVDDAAERKAQAWQSFCKALIGSNEFLYVN